MKKTNFTTTWGGSSSSSNNNNTKGGTPSDKKGGSCTAFSSSSYNNNKNGSYKCESKYSSQGGGAANKDKYSSEQKYSVKNGPAETKYSSQEKYSSSGKGTALERRASYKSVERRDNETNAAKEAKSKYSADSKYGSGGDAKSKFLSDDKYSADSKYGSGGDAKSKFLSDNKYSADSKYGSSGNKAEQSKSSWPSYDTKAQEAKKQAEDKSVSKYKYSSTSSEERWSSKNFCSGPDGHGRTFSSQTSTSSWEERNRGRAFPYDREHELRKSHNKYDTDVRNLDAKYRKAAGLAPLAGLSVAGAAAVPGTAMGAARGVDGGMVQDHHAAGTTGCHNCTVL